MRHEKAKVAAEKEQRRRSRQIYDSKTGLWEWTTTRRHPKELKNWGQYTQHQSHNFGSTYYSIVLSFFVLAILSYC